MRRIGQQVFDLSTLQLGRLNKGRPAGLVNASKSASSSRYASLRFLCVDSGKSDAELQKENDGFFSKIRLTAKMISDEGVREAEKLMEKNVVPDMMEAWDVLFHLQNPLLERYKFDPYDFMDGVRIAVPQILRTIYSKEMAMMRAKRGEASSETLSFLRDTLSTALFLTATQSPSLIKKEKVVTDVSVDKLFMAFAQSRIVTKDWFFRRILEYNLTRSVLGLGENPTDLGAMFQKEGNGAMKWMDLEQGKALLGSDNYPMGSVIAAVAVLVDYKQSSYHISHDISEPVNEKVAENTTKQGQWIFEAVVSGQKEMRWIVRSYDSMAKLGDSLLP